MEIKTNTGLLCGCCGSWFTTWKGYQDQDQDRGFGICESCQNLIRMKAVMELMEISAKVRENFKNPLNRFKWDYMELWERNHYINKMMDDGLITWKFGN